MATAPKTKLYRFQCRECRRRFPDRNAQCGACGSWDTLDVISPTRAQAVPTEGVVSMAQASRAPKRRRAPTGLPWFDNLAGGGLVRGQRVLLGGEEGAGKSTICLQLAAAWAERGRTPLMVAGEMGIRATQEAAARIGAVHKHLYLTEQVEVSALGEKISSRRYGVLIVDSLNVCHDVTLKGEPGGNAQMKACLARLGRLCQDYGIPSVFLAHLNARNAVGGPRWLRHEVDAVLSLTKEKSGGRMLTISKNRNGPEASRRLTMTAKGLKP